MNLPLLARDSAAAPPTAGSDGALTIAETFVSLQGEGKLTGVPSWFCRVSGCNLRCVWCDTPYASWRPEGRRRSVDELVSEALGHAEQGVRHVVLTGGEPLMFPAAAVLARRLREHRLHVTIETAGTVDNHAPADLMSISPKLSSSTPTPAQARMLLKIPTNAKPRGRADARAEVEADAETDATVWPARHEARRLNLPALQSLIDRCPERQLKFVACREADLAEIDALLRKLRGWQCQDVMLMPEGTAPPTPAHKAWVARACMERGWRYCARLHIELYGNTRGT